MEIRKMIPKKVIERTERDEDGYWIYLKLGWQDAENPSCHTIVENTRRQAYAHSVTPCRCNDKCRAVHDFSPATGRAILRELVSR